MTSEYTRITEICFPSTPDYLPHLRKIVACVAAATGMDLQDIQDAKLALNEACANAIRHGSPLGPKNSVRIRLCANGRSIITEVTDEGSGFDPTAIPPKDVAQPGGLGIPLMQALSDNVEFEKNGRGMTVRLTKRVRNGHRSHRRAETLGMRHEA